MNPVPLPPTNSTVNPAPAMPRQRRSWFSRFSQPGTGRSSFADSAPIETFSKTVGAINTASGNAYTAAKITLPVLIVLDIFHNLLATPKFTDAISNSVRDLFNTFGGLPEAVVCHPVMTAIFVAIAVGIGRFKFFVDRKATVPYHDTDEAAMRLMARGQVAEKILGVLTAAYDYAKKNVILSAGILMLGDFFVNGKNRSQEMITNPIDGKLQPRDYGVKTIFDSLWNTFADAFHVIGQAGDMVLFHPVLAFASVWALVSLNKLSNQKDQKQKIDAYREMTNAERAIIESRKKAELAWDPADSQFALAETLIDSQRKNLDLAKQYYTGRKFPEARQVALDVQMTLDQFFGNLPSPPPSP